LSFHARSTEHTGQLALGSVGRISATRDPYRFVCCVQGLILRVFDRSGTRSAGIYASAIPVHVFRRAGRKTGRENGWRYCRDRTVRSRVTICSASIAPLVAARIKRIVVHFDFQPQFVARQNIEDAAHAGRKPLGKMLRSEHGSRPSSSPWTGAHVSGVMAQLTDLPPGMMIRFGEIGLTGVLRMWRGL
jgi:hypothetical protein